MRIINGAFFSLEAMLVSVLALFVAFAFSAPIYLLVSNGATSENILTSSVSAAFGTFVLVMMVIFARAGRKHS